VPEQLHPLTFFFALAEKTAAEIWEGKGGSDRLQSSEPSVADLPEKLVRQGATDSGKCRIQNEELLEENFCF